MNGILHGAELSIYNDIPAVLAWLWGETTTAPESLAYPFAYAVLQCTDSLVWGIFADGRWHWSSSVEPQTAQKPGAIAPTTRTLLEARLFGKDAELLLWRTADFDAETFHGRILSDGKWTEGVKPLDVEMSFSPAEDQPKHPRTKKIIKGATVKPLGEGFVRRTQTNGCITVTPKNSWVQLRHYLAEDSTTGVLRIAATRFVSLEPTRQKANKE